MNAHDIWMIILTATAAAGSLISVGFLIGGALRRRAERPLVDYHVTFTRDKPGFTDQMQLRGKRAVILNVISHGDEVLRHIEVSGNFKILHHHEEERLAVLMPGQKLSLPIAAPLTQRTLKGRILYVTGKGKKIKGHSDPFEAPWNDEVKAE